MKQECKNRLNTMCLDGAVRGCECFGNVLRYWPGHENEKMIFIK